MTTKYLNDIDLNGKLTIASSAGTSGYFLKTDGSGNISWAPVTGTLGYVGGFQTTASAGTTANLSNINQITAPTNASGNVSIFAQSSASLIGAVIINGDNAPATTATVSTPSGWASVQIKGAPNNAATGFAGAVNIGGGYGGGTSTNGGYVYIDGGDTSNGTVGTVNIGTLALSSGASTPTINIGNSVSTTTTTGILRITGPLRLTTGTTATATAGQIEYDGVTFYKTNASAIKSASIASYVYKKQGTSTLTSSTNNQSILNATAASASTGIALTASTTYEFEVKFVLTTSGTTSHTEAVGFYYSGTTSFYNYEIQRTVSNIASSATIYAQVASGTTLTSNLTTTVMTPAITTTQTNAIYIYRGWITTNTAGNWTPVVTFSAAPTGTSTISSGATVKLTPVQSSSGTVNISTWA
jgi:hypothetical protein